MNTVQIIAQMRRIVKIDTSQYTDANALIDLNTLKDEFWTAITTLKRKVNWQRWKTSTIALQSEYTLAEVASDTAGTKQLSWVAINYNWKTYTETWLLKYIPADKVNPYTLPYDWSYYEENQNINNPIYFVADNSYFIAPAPRTIVTNWIKLTWIRKIPDYTLTTTEEEMLLPIDAIQALSFWLAIFWFLNKWADDWVINSAEARRERKKKAALNWIDVRVEENAFINLLPDEQDTTLTKSWKVII